MCFSEVACLHEAVSFFLPCFVCLTGESMLHGAIAGAGTRCRVSSSSLAQSCFLLVCLRGWVGELLKKPFLKKKYPWPFPELCQAWSRRTGLLRGCFLCTHKRVISIGTWSKGTVLVRNPACMTAA